jgi:shikimate kinase
LDERTQVHGGDVSSNIRLGNLVLTGISASGKSSVGRQLAKLLGLGFVDLDELIERSAGKSISDIFARDGEPAFRELERQLLHSLERIRSHVIAIGGGTLQSTEAVVMARKIGPLIWLQSSPAEIARRLFKRVSEMEKRPLFKDLLAEENHDTRRDLIRARVQKLLDERRPWFERSDIVLDASYVTPEMAAQHLKDILIMEGIIRSDHGRFSSWRRMGRK